MKNHILREVIHALRVEYIDHRDGYRDQAAGEIREVIDILLWRLPEVIECNGKDLRCTVTGAYYSTPKVHSEYSVGKLLERVFDVSEYSYFRVCRAIRQAEAEEVLV